MKAHKGMNGRRVSALFLTRRSWTGTTIAEVAQQVRAAGAKSGVYVFEGDDGCALYVGPSLSKLAGRIGEHAPKVMARQSTRIWALEWSCPGVDEVRLMAALLPHRNRETKRMPPEAKSPKVEVLL